MIEFFLESYKKAVRTRQYYLYTRKTKNKQTNEGRLQYV